MYLLTNVAKTQDVPLDGNIFCCNTDQKDRATFMNENIPIQLAESPQKPTEIKFYNTV